MANGHGGKRSGAGRPPKALAYRDAVLRSEAIIAAALPTLTRKLIHRAIEGNDSRAAIYLIDRVCGRPATVIAVPSEDTRKPPRTREEADLLIADFFSEFDPMTVARIAELIHVDAPKALGCVDARSS